METAADAPLASMSLAGWLAMEGLLMGIAWIYIAFTSGLK